MVEDTQAYLVTGLLYGYRPQVRSLAVLANTHQRAVELFRKQYSGAEIHSCVNLAEAREIVSMLEAAKEGRPVGNGDSPPVVDDLAAG